MKYLRTPNDTVDKFQKSQSTNNSARIGIEEQMAKMKKMIKSPLSKRKHEGNTAFNPSKTFGVPLEELLQRNSEDSEIPYVLERITDYIVCYGMKQEGIFRVNGNAKVMEKLKLEFDQTGDADLENSGDIMSIAGLMKMFLRELPEPLIPEHFKTAFLQVHKEYYSDKNECCLRLRNLASKLPEPRRRLLKFLCRFLVHISLHQDSNKMNANALAIVFSPNIFRCSEGVEGFREQAVTNRIVGMLIEEYDIVFKDKNEESPSLSNFIQVQEAKDNSFTGPPAMPIPYEQHKKMKKQKDKVPSSSFEPPEMISPYAEFRLGEDNHLMIGEEVKQKNENHVYASVSKAQREAILNSTIWDPTCISEEAEPYIRSNSPCWQKPNEEPSSPKLGSSPKSRKEYMERTIKESIKEHLFGTNLTSTSEESDKWDSPVEEAPPVPPKIPELLSPDECSTRYQKRKKRRGSKSSQENVRPSDEEAADETDGVKESETRHKHKSDHEPEQGVVRSPKRVHRSKAAEVDTRQPLMINVVDYDSSQKLFTRKEKPLSNDYDKQHSLEELDLAALDSSPTVLSCLTLHRAPPPRRRRPPTLRKRKLPRIDMKASEPEMKTDPKQLPRKPPSPPPRPNLSPSNSISPAVASKLERRKQVRSMPEMPKAAAERDVELDSEGSSCPSDSPTGDSPVSSVAQKSSECVPIIPPLELYKLCERTEDDPMVSPRERYDGAAFDDAMVSPRSRRPGWDVRGFSSECPPSPPGRQESHFWFDKKASTSPKGESSLKELSKRAKSLKKKIKDFEEKFEEENGYKPTQQQDRLPAKKYVSELNKTQKLIQDLKEKRMAERTSSDIPAQNIPSVKGKEPGPEPLLTTVPGTVEQSLEISLRKLREKRELHGRAENVDEMTRDQLQDEKLAVQKALLQHENTFGRPTTKRDKDIMKPLYDRYRTIKRKITNYSLKEFSDSTANSKMPNKADQRSHRKTSPERPSDLDMTAVSQVDTLGSTASEEEPRLAKSLPARTCKKLFDNDMSPVSPLTICVDDPGDSTINVDDVGTEGDITGEEERLLTAKDSDAILHQASTDELLEQQTSALRRKKKLRKRLKTFEDDFAKKTGRKVQKEDRGSHEGDYEEYKKIKARLRLLDALITKQQGNSTI